LTPLHVAVEEGHNELVATLVEAGADVTAEDKVRRFALCASVRRITTVDCEQQHSRLTLPLLSWLQDGWTLLRWAVENGHDKSVETLVKAGANVNAVSKVGMSCGNACFIATVDCKQLHSWCHLLLLFLYASKCVALW